MSKPWTEIDLNSEIYHKAKNVPTNNHEETLKLLAWMVKENKPKVIWEFGPWMGHTTVLMALAGGTQIEKIYSCDNFKWQQWMDLYSRGLKFEKGASFLPNFEGYTKHFKEIIQGIEWNSDFPELPAQLIVEENGRKPDFVFVDFTRDAESLEFFWKNISSQLIPNSTVLVFNYVWEKTQDFFDGHSHELKPIAKYGVAGAFLFVSDVTAHQNGE